MSSAKITVTVVVEPDEDRYHAYCPALPGLHIDSESEEKAFEEVEDAIIWYLDSMKEHGELTSRPGLIVTTDAKTVVRERDFDYAGLS